MTSGDLQTFNQAVQFAQTGQKNQAYQQLKRLQSSYPDDPGLILWLIFTSPHLPESQALLQRLAAVDPHNPSLVAAQQWLAHEQAKLQTAQFNPLRQPVPVPNQPVYAQVAHPQPQPGQPVYAPMSQPQSVYAQVAPVAVQPTQNQPVYVQSAQPQYRQPTYEQVAQPQPVYGQIAHLLPEPAPKKGQPGSTVNRIILLASGSSLVVGLGVVIFGILRFVAK